MGTCKVRGAGGRSRGPAPESIQVAVGWFLGCQDPSDVPRFTNSSGSISQAIGAKRQCCSKEQQEAAAGRGCEPPAPAVLPPPKLLTEPGSTGSPPVQKPHWAAGRTD